MRCAQKILLLTAVLDAEIALNHQPDEWIGIVAEIVIGIVNRAAMEKIRATAVLRRTRHNRPWHAGVRMLDLVAGIGARRRHDGQDGGKGKHEDRKLVSS